MFGLGPATRIYVALGATDMRKGFDGLYGVVQDKLGLEVRTLTRPLRVHRCFPDRVSCMAPTLAHRRQELSKQVNRRRRDYNKQKAG